MSGLPSSVKPIIKEYISLLNEHLPGTLEGLYIHGSIALNAYVENSSDIDFITITKNRLTEEHSANLAYIHTIIANKYKKAEMDGVYILQKDIGKLYDNCDDYNVPYPYFNDGQLRFGEYFNFNPITWSLFKTKGINLLGPEPTAFQIDIQPHQLTSYVLENMNTYWANTVQKVENSMGDLIKRSTAQIDFEIEWIVLGLLRQLFTLKESEIISKMNAGEYGLVHVPEEWHDIINEAIHIRKGVKSTLFNSDKDRLNSTIGFAKYLISFCNNNDFSKEI